MKSLALIYTAYIVAFFLFLIAGGKPDAAMLFGVVFWLTHFSGTFMNWAVPIVASQTSVPSNEIWEYDPTGEYTYKHHNPRFA